MEEDQPRTVFRLIMGGFGLAVCVAGLCCIGLQEGWGKSMSPSQKVPETHRRPRFHSDEHVVSFLPFPIVLRRTPLRHSASRLVAQVPIYFLLGTTLSFSVIFGFGEIVNMGMAHFTVTACLVVCPALWCDSWVGSAGRGCGTHLQLDEADCVVGHAGIDHGGHRGHHFWIARRRGGPNR